MVFSLCEGGPVDRVHLGRSRLPVLDIVARKSRQGNPRTSQHAPAAATHTGTVRTIQPAFGARMACTRSAPEHPREITFAGTRFFLPNEESERIAEIVVDALGCR